MRKKYLSALLFGALLFASAGTFTSCKDYDDDLNSLSERIDEVKKQIQEIQQLISSGAVITNVESTSNGVIVTLSNGKTFELTNGVDGEAGTPGSVVSIGENGNWFIDGEDTGLGAQGPQGEQGPAGEDGVNAVGYIYYYPGTEGAEDGYWVEVTVDAEGVETKKITPNKWTTSISSGVVAIMDGEDLILRNVEGANGDVVISLSADLKSLVFQRQMVLDGQNAFEYPYLPYKAKANPNTKMEGTLKVYDPNNCDDLLETAEYYYVIDGVQTAEKNSYVNPLKEVDYHMNPNFTNVAPFKDMLTVVSDDVDFLATRSVNNAAAQPTATYVKHDSESGMLTVGYRMSGHLVKDQENNNPYNLFEQLDINKKKITSLALQANFEDTDKDPVTSTYSAVYAPRIAVEAIAYQEGTELDNYRADGAIGTGHSEVTSGIHLYKNVQDAAEGVATIEIAYNNEKGINLNKILSTHYVNNSRTESGRGGEVQYWNSREELAKMDLYYKFDKVPFYVGENNKTSQSAHCIIEAENQGKLEEGRAIDSDAYFVACGVTSQSDIKVEGFTDEEKRAKSVGSIGRTPLIRVSLVNNMGTADTADDEVVEVRYIKFKITSPETPKWTSLFDMEDFYYGCEGTTKNLTWHAIETRLLEDVQVQMSKEEFRANYKLSTIGSAAVQYYKSNEVDVNGQPIFVPFPTNLGVITEIQDSGAESTDVLRWFIDVTDFESFRKTNDVNKGVEVTENGYETVVTYTRYVKYTPKDDLNHGISKEPIFMPIKVTMKYPKGFVSNKIAAYWFDTADMNAANTKPNNDESKMKEVHLNVEAPETTVDGKPAACDFVNDLDDAFLLNTTRQHNPYGTAVNDNAPKFNLQNAPQFGDFDDNDLGYVYYFTAANDGKTVVGQSGNSYTLSVDNTNLVQDRNNVQYINYGGILNCEAGNDKLYANGELIAKIDRNTGKITYIDNTPTNSISEDLLNRPEVLLPRESSDRLTNALCVEIGIAAYNKCGILLPLDNNTFDARFTKPVYVEPLGDVEFTDAVDATEEGAKVNVAELVKLTDWREREFTDTKYLSYYNYYEVTDMAIDVKEIKTNISGVMKPLKEVSNGVEFHFNPGTGSIPANPTWNDIVNAFGTLTYYNRTGHVVTFNIEIPVKVTYKWGTITVWVEGTVNRTENN